MNLPLYSSTADLSLSNLVGLQHPDLAWLPPQLVCPILKNLTINPLCARFQWGGSGLVVDYDLFEIGLLQRKRKGHGRLGRVETGIFAGKP